MGKRKQNSLMEVKWLGIGNFSGYSVAAAYYVKALRELGVKVQYENFPGLLDKRFKKYFPFLFDGTKVSSNAFEINHSIGNPSSRQILYQVWDGVTCPETLVKWASNARELWTCSEFSKRSYWISGVGRPIIVIPHGVDTEIFNANQSPLYNFKRFTFLTSMFSHDQKENAFNLSAVFLKEFHGEPVNLLVHTRPDQKKNLIKDIRGILNFSRPFNQIKFTDKCPLTMKGMAKLYASCNAYVSATRGESFSLNAIEAAAMDKPVIVTYFGGQKEFLKDKAFYVQPERLETFALIENVLSGKKEAIFAKPLELMMRMQMREVYQNYELAKTVARGLGKDIRENWTWENQAKKIIRRLEAIKC